jgi:DNA modification methylase
VKINDIDMRRWKEYDEIITDSLWIFPSRDNSGAHTPEYHGNFIPQIPRQAMLRFTRRGERVLDAFTGLGTTLIEAKRMGRHAVGIEINSDIAKKAKELVEEEGNPYGVDTKIIVGDSTKRETYENLGNFQLLILHPPYWDIIKFSDIRGDLSNTRTIDSFLESFEKVVQFAGEHLDRGRYLVLVIGDKYSHGSWIPLGFYTMDIVMRNGYNLKSIVVKNIEENRGKRGQYALWRYRALKDGYYIFKHEYVMFFEKTS